MMDKAWNRMEIPPNGSLTDIFQGSVIRELKGGDGKHFGHTGTENAGRYLFALSADSFNPLGNRQAGKKISVALLTMVCVNLPIEIRYLPENIFIVGIIPGPEEPKLDAVNPYLDPLVDVLLLFWKGILFSKTFLYETGRLIFCALIALIADLPAARKFGGFASYSHEFFCSKCWCTRTEHGYDNFDYASWRGRTNADCRRHAEAFRFASTEEEAASSFDRTGL